MGSNRRHLLLTGGRGFVGKAALAALGDRWSAPSSSELDLEDRQGVEDYFATHRPRIVVHLAARVGGITANLARPGDFLLDNQRMDTNVLTASAKYVPEHLLLMLSTCMYPDRLPDSEYPMTEDRIEDGPPPSSNAAYAAAKRALLHGAHAIHEQYDVPFTALVPSNLYGPGDHFGSSSSHFLAAAITKIERARIAGAPHVEFFGTGTALRQFLFVDDLAALIAEVLNIGPLNRAINVAPTHNLSIKELAKQVAEAAEYDAQIRFSGEGPDGQYRKDVSTSRLESLIPRWESIETPLAIGLRRTIDWFRNNVASR